MPRKSIGATAFKAECLRILDEVAKTRQPVTITKRGRPVAELYPAARTPKSLYGAMKGSVLYEGDLLSPLDEEWEANK